MEPRRRLQARTPAQKAVPTNGDGRLALCRRRRARSRSTSQVTSDHDLGLNDGLATQHDVLRADEDGLAGNLVARVLFFCSPLRKASAPMTRAVGDIRRERAGKECDGKKERKKNQELTVSMYSPRGGRRDILREAAQGRRSFSLLFTQTLIVYLAVVVLLSGHHCHHRPLSICLRTRGLLAEWSSLF